jgi:hypothetical protein
MQQLVNKQKEVNYDFISTHEHTTKQINGEKDYPGQFRMQ